jgi:DNA-binding NtrC family response regulator
MTTKKSAASREDLAEEIFEENRYFEEQKYGVHRGGGSHEILVAEDDDDMRGLVADALRADGFAVVEARSGTELRNLIWSRMRGGSRPVGLLIVTDVRMQGATGLELLAELRERDWSTPIVLMTGFGDARVHAEAEKLGALAVFDKPFDIRDLQRLVRPWLNP